MGYIVLPNNTVSSTRLSGAQTGRTGKHRFVGSPWALCLSLTWVATDLVGFQHRMEVEEKTQMMRGKKEDLTVWVPQVCSDLITGPYPTFGCSPRAVIHSKSTQPILLGVSGLSCLEQGACARHCGQRNGRNAKRERARHR